MHARKVSTFFPQMLMGGQQRDTRARTCEIGVFVTSFLSLVQRSSVPKKRLFLPACFTISAWSNKFASKWPRLWSKISWKRFQRFWRWILGEKQLSGYRRKFWNILKIRGQCGPVGTAKYSTLPVTGLGDSHPRLIASLGNFSRTVWLPLLSTCNLHSLTPLFLCPFFFSLHIARFVLGSLKC